MEAAGSLCQGHRPAIHHPADPERAAPTAGVPLQWRVVYKAFAELRAGVKMDRARVDKTCCRGKRRRAARKWVELEWALSFPSVCGSVRRAVPV